MNSIFKLVVLSLLPATVHGAPLRFQCPETYPTKPAAIVETPSAWTRTTAQVSPGLRLSGGGLIGGPLDLQPPAELRGSDAPAPGGWLETRYPAIGETWAFCSYGQGGEIRLFRRVDSVGVRECVMRSLERRVPARTQVEVICK